MTLVRHPCALVGLAPSESARPWDPTAGSTRNLAKLAGVKPDKLRELFFLDNLTNVPRPSRTQLKLAAQRYPLEKGRPYILVGTEVARAFGRRAYPGCFTGARLPWYGAGAQACEWYRNADGAYLAQLPHPSGRNRWYNDARCRRAAEKFLREAAMTSPHYWHGMLDEEEKRSALSTSWGFFGD